MQVWLVHAGTLKAFSRGPCFVSESPGAGSCVDKKQPEVLQTHFELAGPIILLPKIVDRK